MAKVWFVREGEDLTGRRVLMAPIPTCRETPAMSSAREDRAARSRLKRLRRQCDRNQRPTANRSRLVRAWVREGKSRLGARTNGTRASRLGEADAR